MLQESNPLMSPKICDRFNLARNWLMAEAQRFGWSARNMEEGTKTIQGQLVCNDANLDRDSAVHFEIKASCGTPIIVLRKCGNIYRVYHEFEFHNHAIYSLRKVLVATTAAEAETAAWVDRGGKFMRKMSWWSVFLREELEACKEDDPKLTELRALIKSAGTPSGLIVDPPEPTVPDYGPVAAKLMAMMGYKEGMGLGKNGNGIKEPIMAKCTNFIGSSEHKLNVRTDNREICFVRQIVE